MIARTPVIVKPAAGVSHGVRVTFTAGDFFGCKLFFVLQGMEQTKRATGTRGMGLELLVAAPGGDVRHFLEEVLMAGVSETTDDAPDSRLGTRFRPGALVAEAML